MASFLDHNFGDESDDEGDFNPEQGVDSDAESNNEIEKDRAFEAHTNGKKRIDGDDRQPIEKPRKASHSERRSGDDEGDGEDQASDAEGSQDDVDNDDDEEDEEDEEDAISVGHSLHFSVGL